MQTPQTWRDAVVQTAIQLCHHGIRVFPCAPRTKVPLRGMLWKDQATNDPNRLLQILPPGEHNIAAVLGPSSGILDIEPDDELANLLVNQLMQEAGVRTIAYQSSRGIHRLFRWDEPLMALKHSNPKVGKLECRLGTDAKGAYSIVPPSIHDKTGQFYTWLPGCSPWEVAPAPLPDNIRQYFLSNATNTRKDKSQVPVSLEQDGFLPEIGYRHEYLLKTALLLRVNQRLPSAIVKDMVRPLSQAIGSYEEPGRGEQELDNLVRKLELPRLPEEEMSSIDFQAGYELASEMLARHREDESGGLPEIPADVFPAWIQQASEYARGSQLPRNLWLMTTLTATAFSLGAAVRVRAASTYPTTGLQIYSFGVGDSGTGKSRTLNSLLAPFFSSEAVFTDATSEALQTQLARFPRGVMIELSEGKDFTKMLGRYNQAQGAPSDNSLFHKCWSGDRIRVIRQTKSVVVEKPHVVVSAAIQKLNLNQIPQNDILDGLMQRMLVYPLGTSLKKPIPDCPVFLSHFDRHWPDVLTRLCSVKPFFGQLFDVGSGIPADALPLTLTLTEEGKRVWEDYAAYKRSDEVEAQWPDEHPFRSDVLRHAEYVLRIAACLMMVDLAGNGPYFDSLQINLQYEGLIDVKYVRNAITLVEWCWYHKQRLMDHLVETSFSKASQQFTEGGESIIDGMTRQIQSRRKRIERRCGAEWTLRDYYRTLGLKRVNGEGEVAALLRDGVVEALPQQGNKGQKYRFVQSSGEAHADSGSV